MQIDDEYNERISNISNAITNVLTDLSDENDIKPEELFHSMSISIMALDSAMSEACNNFSATTIVNTFDDSISTMTIKHEIKKH